MLYSDKCVRKLVPKSTEYVKVRKPATVNGGLPEPIGGFKQLPVEVTSSSGLGISDLHARSDESPSNLK